MPRAFDSEEQQAADGLLVFFEHVTCPRCGVESEGMFLDDSIAVQDIVDPPQGWQRCPSCEFVWRAAMTGWTFFSEAG